MRHSGRFCFDFSSLCRCLCAFYRVLFSPPGGGNLQALVGNILFLHLSRFWRQIIWLISVSSGSSHVKNLDRLRGYTQASNHVVHFRNKFFNSGVRWCCNWSVRVLRWDIVEFPAVVCLFPGWEFYPGLSINYDGGCSTMSMDSCVPEWWRSVRELKQ